MKQAITIAVNSNTPLMLWGPPGCGKSQGMSQWCKENDYEYIDIRLSQKDAVDLMGIPYRNPKTNRTEWAVPSIWPTDPDKKYLIAFDEIHHGTQATLSASFQAIQERRIGDYFFPDSVRFVAAGNRAKDRTYANQMPSALRNRFGHGDVESGEEDWLSWATSVGIDPRITGFIRFSPPSLNEFIEHSQSEDEKKRASLVKTHNAFATPRSWEATDRVLKVADFKTASNFITGLIGEEIFAKFKGYIDYYQDLPDLDDLIKNPNKFEAPSGLGLQFAIISGLAAKANMKNIPNIVKYILRLPAEMQAYCMKDALSREPTIGATPAFSEWAEANEDILF